MTPKEVFKLMADKGVKFVDLRFTDTRGKEQHVSVPIASFGPEKFDSGHYFDGSSIAGWKGIQAFGMMLRVRLDRLRAVCGRDHPEALGLQPGPDRLRDRVLVVHDQDRLLTHGRHRTRPRLPTGGDPMEKL